MASRGCVLLSLLFAWFSTAVPQSFPPGNRIHWNKTRGFTPFAHATPDAILINDTLSSPITDAYKLATPSSDFYLRFTAANFHNHPSKTYSYLTPTGDKKKIGYPAWQFFVMGNNGDSLIVKIQTKELSDALSSQAGVHIKIHNSAAPQNTVETDLKDDIDCFTGYNNWQLSINDGNVSLSCGNRSLKAVLTLQTTMTEVTEFGFSAYPGACLNITTITYADNSKSNLLQITSWSNPDHLRNYLAASKDPMEGYWTVFDRTLEESLLQLGGDYRLAIVKDNDSYLIIYIDGARINAETWKPGTIKGRLIPDLFPDIYNVIWIDSEGLPLSKDIKAQIGEGETLTIQFPYQSSSLRLRHIPFQ